MQVCDEKEKNVEEIKKETTENKKLEKKEKCKIKKEPKNKVKILIYFFIILSILLLLSCTIFSLLNINNIKIIKGITINDINIENLTIEEAENQIKKEIIKELNKDINITAEEFEYSIKLEQIELEYKISEAVEKAYRVGRDGNIITNNFNILESMIKGKNIKLEYSYNQNLLENIVNEIALKIPGAVEEVNYNIENEMLHISKGKTGNTINKEKLKEEILEQVDMNKRNNIVLEIYQVEPQGINIEKIYNEIYTEPKDAYYVKEPFEVFPHTDGIKFDIEQAKEILKEDKEKYEIPLIITKPEITINEIGSEAFPDLISTFSTKYNANEVARTTNLKLAINSLNGVVLAPGETFSYNKTLGKRTRSAGYKDAGGYENGRLVQMVGGGICQISSTLYNSVVYANLEIVERHNHMFVANYVGAGKDATVSYGTLDFKFKNTRNHPITIKATIGGGIATISIYGFKEETEYDVEISTKILNYTPYKVIYEDDNTLEEGKEKVSQGGMNGCKSITYKIVSLNGEEISKTVLSSDTYKAMDKIIKKGTAKPVENIQQPIIQEQAPIITPEQPTIPDVSNTNSGEQEENNVLEETIPQESAI